jgi:hypothetical protein
MLRKHMDGTSASGTMFRTRFGCALGAANAGWIDLSVDAPLLFQLKRDVEHLSAEEQCEIARRDPGIWLELGRRLVLVGPDEEGRRVLLRLYRCPDPGSPGCGSDMSEWEGSTDSAEDAAAIVMEFLRDPISTCMERVVGMFPTAGFGR